MEPRHLSSIELRVTALHLSDVDVLAAPVEVAIDPAEKDRLTLTEQVPGAGAPYASAVDDIDDLIQGVPLGSRAVDPFTVEELRRDESQVTRVAMFGEGLYQPGRLELPNTSLQQCRDGRCSHNALDIEAAMISGAMTAADDRDKSLAREPFQHVSTDLARRSERAQLGVFHTDIQTVWGCFGRISTNYNNDIVRGKIPLVKRLVEVYK